MVQSPRPSAQGLVSGICASIRCVIRCRESCSWLLSCFDFDANGFESVSKDARAGQHLLLGQLGQGFLADEWRLNGAVVTGTMQRYRWLVRGVACLEQLHHQAVGILPFETDEHALVVDAFQEIFKRSPASSSST